MTVSVFDLFKPGVGPSSSHTMGPMTAAARFVAELGTGGLIAGVSRVQVKLYASLALTGRGHATDRATMLGLLGFESAIRRDYPVMFGTLYIFTLLGLVMHIVGDVMYTVVDPRIDFEARG